MTDSTTQPVAQRSSSTSKSKEVESDPEWYSRHGNELREKLRLQSLRNHKLRYRHKHRFQIMWEPLDVKHAEDAEPLSPLHLARLCNKATFIYLDYGCHDEDP